MNLPMDGMKIILDNDINMAGREGKNDIFVDAVGLELLYIKPNGFYIKLD
ncbi:hypothetical protein I9B70_03065 [Campylobacter coli]|nr:hypothetical protein [Campylobacter coli]